MSTFVLSLYALCRIEQTIGSQRLHCLPEHELICERFDRYHINWNQSNVEGIEGTYCHQLYDSFFRRALLNYLGSLRRPLVT